MQIVIEITDRMYEAIKQDHVPIDIGRFIRNGTPLPKGHGRIADMDEAIKCIEDVEGDDAIWAINLIDWACSKRTIIEADKYRESEG